MNIMIGDFLFKDSDLLTNSVQKTIRYLYEKEIREASCMCVHGVNNPLKIIYTRSNDTFTLRKPKYIVNNHSLECRYAKTYKHIQRGKKSTNNFGVSLSHNTTKGISDHARLKLLFNALIKHLDDHKGVRLGINSWYEIDKAVKEIDNEITINNLPLNDVLQVIKPVSFANLERLNLPNPKIILCEIYKIKIIKSSGDVMFFIKGIKNQGFLNNQRIDEKMICLNTSHKIGMDGIRFFGLFSAKTFGNNVQITSACVISTP